MADPTPGLLDNIKLSIPDISKLPVSAEIKNIDKAASQMFDHLPMMMLNVVLGIMLIVGGWLVCSWVAGKLNHWLVKAHMEETLAAFLASTSRFVLFFTIFVTGLSVVGVSSTSLAALLGAMGLAVGFAMRGTLGSIAGGIMLMVHRPVKVGDYIENGIGTSLIGGTVKRIGLFSTEINTKEFVRVFIPNVMMWETLLQNHTYNRMHMLRVEFALGHEVNVWEAFGVIKRALAANPLVLKTPDPTLSVENLNEFGISCLLEVWTRTEDRKVLRGTILLDVMDALRENGMRMAYQEPDHLNIYGKPAHETLPAIKAGGAKKALADEPKDDKLPASTK